MSTKIEAKGMQILEAWLSDHGRGFRRVPDAESKTFDYFINDAYAELKTSTQGFVALTGPQYRALEVGELARVFDVNHKTGVVTEYTREHLLKIEPKHYETFEFSKAKLSTVAHTCEGMIPKRV